MELNRYEYLKTTRYKNISTWDFKSFFDRIFESKYPIVPLGDYIKEENKKYDISIPNEKYGILGVDNKIGIFDAYMENGKNINQKYKKMETGWIAYNPYRVNVGSIGIKKSEHKYDYISPAYVVFSCKPQLFNEYLFLLFKTSKFNKIIRKSTTGAVRQTLSYTILKTLQIPLPPVEEQKKMVEEYKNKIQEAEKLEKQMATKYANINTLLFTELGVEISKDTIFKSLSTISFSSLDRWDIGYLQNSSKFSAKYKPIKFRDCIDCFMKTSEGKSLRMETFKIPSKKFHYIGMEHIEKATGQLLDIPIVKGSQIKSQTVVVPNGYFIYGKLRPYLNKYWLNNTNWDDIVCSSELFVFKIKNSINTRFFELVLGSNIVQEQIADLTSGARMPRITEDIFMNIRIPIPPIEIQNSIVSNIDSIAENIKDLKILALQKRTMALQNFETEIFE